MYQIYPRSFCDSNHDGIGDIQGIISKLDYLKDLGVTMLWIWPMYKSPLADNGYDISDYYDMLEDYGTMKDVDELIAEAKKRNIGILMNLVINHTSSTDSRVRWAGAFHENHDMPRSLNRLVKNPADRNGKAAKLLGSLLMFLKSTPYIYAGEEIGMINNERLPIDEFDDISSHNQYTRALEEGYPKEEALHFVNRRSRDNTRSPMCWNSSEYGGFSDVKPWLALNEHASEINVEKQINDPDSVLSFY